MVLVYTRHPLAEDAQVHLYILAHKVSSVCTNHDDIAILSNQRLLDPKGPCLVASSSNCFLVFIDPWTIF